MSIQHASASIHFGYATVSLGQIHYAQAGAPEAPPLILMHAAGRSSSCYRHLLPLLAEDFRAIAIDLPGFGYSARMTDTPTIDGLAR
jgi:pimeloyl-ACP methyl ester carboxylesterase